MTVPASAQSVIDVDTKTMNKPHGFQTAICNWCGAYYRAILAELISTMLLILFGCMTCIPIDGFTPHPPLYAPLGFGLIVSFNVQIFGHISGAHMNPAVTLASLIWGGTAFPLAVVYIVVQCIGATLGYGILMAVSPIDLVPDDICVTMPHAGVNSIQALGVEVALTAALAFLCCACWDPVNEHKQESVAIKFGLAIAGLSIAGAPLTGASMNPARSFGPVVWTGTWSLQWLYWAGPLIGCSIAALFYKYVLLKKKHTC